MGCTRVLRVTAIGALTALVLVGCGGDDDDDDATVSFKAPADGATVAGSVALEMTADGIEIEEAGEARDGAGHFHVIADDGCVAAGDAVPKDADHVHFGSGASEGKIYLEPGEHELCLQAADGVHSALAATDTVSITVGVESMDEWCGVVHEIDALFESLDNDGEDFAIRQLGYENVRRLTAQLQGGLDVVDADAREMVGASITAVGGIASAFVDAEDERDEIFETMYDTFGPDMEAGAPWISDACDIEL
jgi:hypothetical protein